MALDLLIKAVTAVAPVLVLLFVFDRLDIFNLITFRTIMLLVLTGGAIATFAYFANWRVEADVFPIGRSNYSRYVAPPVEESLKAALIVALFAFNRLGFKLDAAIAGFAMGRSTGLLSGLYTCVFRLEQGGLALVEIAPGIEIERDILERLPFRPAIYGPREMDPRVFRSAPMRLREQMLDLRMEDRLSYDRATNTVYMNFSGLRVRDAGDLKAIGDAVDSLLAPLGNRVHSIVNYERFTCDDDVFDDYLDLVKRVEQAYYLSVKRYTSGAFLRHKLGTELAKRDISSEILDPSTRNSR